MLLLLALALGYSPKPDLGVQPTHEVSKKGSCGGPGQAPCTSVVDEITINSCFSATKGTTIGALPTASDGTGYKCLPCSLPTQRACECTDEAADSEGVHIPPCASGLSHWCLFEPQYIAQTATDGLVYCVHNATDTSEQAACGTEGHEACFRESTDDYQCFSPTTTKDGQIVTVSGIRDSTLATATLVCQACGKSGLPACSCVTDSTPDACAGAGSLALLTRFCDGDGDMYLSGDELFCR